jgi:hypothetical protein
MWYPLYRKPNGHRVDAETHFNYTQKLSSYLLRSAPYTLSVKLSDFAVWYRTRSWRKNWVKYAVLTANNAGLRNVFSSRLTHRELLSSLRVSHSFLSVPADTTMASSQGTQTQHPFLTINLADEHRMIHSFSNTTSYSTFDAFFSYFRMALWPIWLANSKRQPCFYPPYSHAQKHTQTLQKTDKPDRKLVLCQRTFSSVFVQFFTQLNCTA